MVLIVDTYYYCYRNDDTQTQTQIHKPVNTGESLIIII